MPTRKFVPVRNVKSYGTLIDDFDDTGWAGSPQVGTGSIDTENTEHYLAGSGAVKLSFPSDETRVLVSKSIAADYSDVESFTLWLYLNTTQADIELRFYEGDNNHRYVTETDEVYPAGWYAITVSKNDFIASTTPPASGWANIDLVRLWCTTSSPAVFTGYEVWIDSLYYDVKVRPKVTVIFDDGTTSDYSKAFSYMNPRGLVGSSAIYSDAIDSGGTFLTSAEIDEMYAAGWEICNHSSDGLRAIDVGGEAVFMDNLAECKNFISSSGWTGSEDIVVMPGCYQTSTLIQSMKAAGYRYARRCESQGNDLISTASHPDNESATPVNMLAIVGYYHNPGGSKARDATSAKAYIDTLIRTGSSGFMEFHQIVASGATDAATNEPEFQEIMDYLALHQNEGLIDVVTFDQYIRSIR